MNITSWIVVIAVALLFLFALSHVYKTIFGGAGCGCHGGGEDNSKISEEGGSPCAHCACRGSCSRAALKK